MCIRDRVPDLGEQWVIEHHGEVEALECEADVVGERDDERRGGCRAGVQAGFGHGRRDKRVVLWRDARQQRGEVVGVASVGGDERASDLVGGDDLTRPGLVAQATACLLYTSRCV